MYKITARKWLKYYLHKEAPWLPQEKHWLWELLAPLYSNINNNFCFRSFMLTKWFKVELTAFSLQLIMIWRQVTNKIWMLLNIYNFSSIYFCSVWLAHALILTTRNPKDQPKKLQGEFRECVSTPAKRHPESKCQRSSNLRNGSPKSKQVKGAQQRWHCCHSFPEFTCIRGFEERHVTVDHKLKKWD